MLLSANDGANVIAETVSGDIPHFVELMNNTAAAFGCFNTHFVNAHGYHDDNHYSTARDMAIIAREAMKNESFREIACQRNQTRCAFTVRVLLGRVRIKRWRGAYFCIDVYRKTRPLG